MSPSAQENKERRRAEREGRIVAVARALAEQDGWESVTTRRLAETIEYSQPVLYGHFPEGKSQIVTAVALVGFEELAARLSESISPGAEDTGGASRVRALVTAYLDFAERHPATYEAMFRLPIGAPFASADTPLPMKEGFDAIVRTFRDLEQPPTDVDGAAEVLWATMHGLATLRRAGRVHPEHHQRRIDELVRRIAR